MVVDPGLPGVGGHTPASVPVHLPRIRAVPAGDAARTDDEGRTALAAAEHPTPTDEKNTTEESP